MSTTSDLVRRELDRVRSLKGMRVGNPKVTLDAALVERLVIEAENNEVTPDWDEDLVDQLKLLASHVGNYIAHTLDKPKYPNHRHRYESMEAAYRNYRLMQATRLDKEARKVNKDKCREKAAANEAALEIYANREMRGYEG